jgi:hypothetical protein
MTIRNLCPQMNPELLFVGILFPLGPTGRSVHFHTGVSRHSYAQDSAAEAQGGGKTQSGPRGRRRRARSGTHSDTCPIGGKVTSLFSVL